jgi:N-acetylglucosaminyldiphosphoundecaprenol N-acetyl-beta-D-mannosaminyltransferase
MIQLNKNILGVRVDLVSTEDASEAIVNITQEGHKYVCAANVHMIMECHDNVRFKDVVNSASLVVPDGKPLVWALKALGANKVDHVTGFSLTKKILEKAQAKGINVGFYGGRKAVLEEMIKRIKIDFPTLKIGYVFSPPFIPLSEKEKRIIIDNIVQSEVKILFVGLGCPKQENWMAEHIHQIPVVMIGVGAVFDFLAGTIPRAPKFLQEIGLAWLFRLILEPKRLWRRYLVENPRFIAKFSGQFFKYSKY